MPPAIQWVVTTQTAPWQAQPELTMQSPTSMPGVFVRLDMPQQTIQGFGACFNELGWDALNDLSAAAHARQGPMHALDQGGEFSGRNRVVPDIGGDNIRRHLDDFVLFFHIWHPLKN